MRGRKPGKRDDGETDTITDRGLAMCRAWRCCRSCRLKNGTAYLGLAWFFTGRDSSVYRAANDTGIDFFCVADDARLVNVLARNTDVGR